MAPERRSKRKTVKSPKASAKARKQTRKKAEKKKASVGRTSKSKKKTGKKKAAKTRDSKSKNAKSKTAKERASSKKKTTKKSSRTTAREASEKAPKTVSRVAASAAASAVAPFIEAKAVEVNRKTEAGDGLGLPVREWMENASQFAEQVIRSIRRKYTDQVLPFGRRILGGITRSAGYTRSRWRLPR